MGPRDKEAVMAKFLVLAMGTSVSPGMSPAEMQRIFKKYQDWTASLAQAGRLHDGNKLASGEGKMLRRRDDRLSVTDGPYAESKEALGGYWLIAAADYEDAV